MPAECALASFNWESRQWHSQLACLPSIGKEIQPIGLEGFIAHHVEFDLKVVILMEAAGRPQYLKASNQRLPLACFMRKLDEWASKSVFHFFSHP